MAVQEHLELLKHSVREWNLWRERAHIFPDLSEANLSGALLRKINLRGANLRGANLSNANLSMADLSHADFSFWRSHGGRGSIVRGTALSNTNLSGANLSNANLSGTRLSNANLNEADLSGANLSNANLNEADLSNARFAYTTFSEVDLTSVKGLNLAIHHGRSSVDINSVILPLNDRVRNHFLRGVGFTETQIEYLPSLLTPRPIEYASLFISYAHQDEAIANRLHTDLRKKDVPCWFAPHDLRPGTPILRGIEEAIHLQEKFLLILSHHAVNSLWVQHEVEAALYKQMDSRKEILFPIRLDNTILESNTQWAKRLRKYHIGDFTGWQNDVAYRHAFAALLRHLEVDR